MPAKPRRPFGVTLVALLVLTIASLNLLRFVLSLLQRQFLGSLEGVSPLYLALTGLVWASIGLALFWGLWRRKRWAPRAVGWGALLYAVYDWLDRIFFSGWLKSRQPPANLAFTAGLTLVTLAFIIWTLSRPKIKAIYGVPYGEPHERSS
jgi:hypothetical protein